MNEGHPPLSAATKVVLLLAGHFQRGGRAEELKPLDLREFNRLTALLVERGARLEHLVDDDVDLSDMAHAAGIDPARLKNLLARGPSMALAVEQWRNYGTWVLSRIDETYPRRLLEHLGDGAPPLLFGVGSSNLLERGGLAIIGSRNVDRAGETFTKTVAGVCGSDGIQVVSGGARGVDRIAMLEGLEGGASVIGVSADNLIRAAVTPAYREAIVEGRLTLVTPYAPDGRFSVGKAMGRNKLIYALADFALVVSAAKGSGGTWTGAVEELKRRSPRPVFVRMGASAPPGNHALLDRGAIAFPDDWEERGLSACLEAQPQKRPKNIPAEPPVQISLPFAQEPQTAEIPLGVKEPGPRYRAGDKPPEPSSVD